MADPIAQLQEAGIPDPQREWRKITAHFEGPAREEALARRVAREPLSHILGYRDFWKDRFFVNSDVLDPRPDSELFLELIGEGDAQIRILDLGSGSGALGLSALRQYPNAHVTFVDVSEKALDVAKRNAGDLGLLEKCTFILSDWLTRVQEKFHIILCNPPYIRQSELPDLLPELTFEPPIALSPGGDGLAPYEVIAQSLSHVLEAGGHAYFEHGHLQQSEVVEIFGSAGFQTKKYSDLSENPRIVQVFYK